MQVKIHDDTHERVYLIMWCIRHRLSHSWKDSLTWASAPPGTAPSISPTPDLESNAKLSRFQFVNSSGADPRTWIPRVRSSVLAAWASTIKSQWKQLWTLVLPTSKSILSPRVLKWPSSACQAVCLPCLKLYWWIPGAGSVPSVRCPRPTAMASQCFPSDAGGPSAPRASAKLMHWLETQLSSPQALSPPRFFSGLTSCPWTCISAITVGKALSRPACRRTAWTRPSGSPAQAARSRRPGACCSRLRPPGVQAPWRGLGRAHSFWRSQPSTCTW